jgi:hypothetical protein
MAASAALFQRDGDVFHPSELTRGPWNPDAQHGGAPAALLARCATLFEGGEAMLVARLTIELLRPVPLAPLTAKCAFERPGKKVQLVRAALFAGATEVVRTTALRIRCKDMALPALADDLKPPPPPQEGRSPSPARLDRNADRLAYHCDAVEHCFVAGSFADIGPSQDWIRLRHPVVAGEETLPLSRVAAAADFGNGISRVLDRDAGYTFINPDLTIYVHRLPQAEWVCLDARTHVQAHGVGMAESRLWDEQGPIGRSVQSLLIDK